MANPEHLGILIEGIEQWNRWRKQASHTTPDLSGADLRKSGIRGRTLAGENLRGEIAATTAAGGAGLAEVVAYGRYLSGVNFRKTDLSTAILYDAELSEADLSGADLRNADVRKAHLIRTDLCGADLRGANLKDASLSGAIFGDSNLRGAKGLENCRHATRSIIDHQTIAKSWPVPVSFLRGCGLPDSYIEYLPSLLNDAVQFYSCFISYSTKDQDFTDRLYLDLQNQGVRCWFAPHDIQGGKKINEQIDEAIRLYDRLLLILSERSMNSEWVKTEIAHARQKELNERRQVLFPVSLVPFAKVQEWKCFDADTGKDSAREIREYFIPDFSNWKDHESYQAAFEKLVRDLKAEETKGVKERPDFQ
jgi:hypothetical protein